MENNTITNMECDNIPPTQPPVETGNKDDTSPEQYYFNSWDELETDNNILRGIYAYGFENPSEIQKKAIKAICSGKDVVAQAQSGTGKTAAFSIGVLNKLDVSKNKTQAIIISPTKELTNQTAKVIRSLGSMVEGLRIQELFGKCDIDEGNSFNRVVPHVICGCPGKIFDMMYRNKISISHIGIVVLDEADELLSRGFIDQIFSIFQRFPNNIQVVLSSATFPTENSDIVSRLTHNPIRVEVAAEQLTLKGITQYYVKVDDDLEKYATLKDIYGFISLSQCIIYCNSISRVNELHEMMTLDSFPVCCIHGGMDKQERNASFNEFKSGEKRVLISSNVTARGIDIQQVSTVINFDVPKSPHTYLHRIGRSGRWGRKGVGINFVSREDVSAMKHIENHYQTEINELPSNLDNLNVC
jgi:translation initiation factor 4A